MHHFESNSQDESFDFGRRIGEWAEPGTVVALNGDLGAGKTVVARGVGKGLRVSTRVQSPTFILVQTHEGGRLPFWHADLYRLNDEEELLYLGLDEFIEAGGIVVLEWASRFPQVLPEHRLDVEISHRGPGLRRFEWVGRGEQHEALARALAGE